MTASPRPFRFGVQIARVRSREEWVAAARRAEEIGFDVFLMPDHFGAQLAIGPALTVVAQVTNLRIGTLVLQNDLRHPALLAKEAATLDVLSDGRFEFGIGAGGSFPPEFDWTGIPFDPPATRVARLEESIQLFKAFAAPDPVTHAGTFFTFREYNAQPKPVQQPHPPIFIAAGGPRMLDLAAREADIIGLLPHMLQEGGFADGEESLEVFAAKVERIRAIAGARSPRIELNLLIQLLEVTDDREATIARLRGERDYPAGWFDSPMCYVGSVEEITAQMRRVRERLGVSYFALFEPVMEIAAPIVTALAGT